MKPQRINFSIKDKVFETEDSVTLVLEPQNNLPFPYHAGQFITLFVDFPDQGEVQRSYSFSSSPVADDWPAITIKKVNGGLVSCFLVDKINIGDSLVASNSLGHFYDPYKELENETPFYLFSAGSGVTPVYSIAKTLLETSDHKIYFIYSNKDKNNIIFADPLSELQKCYPERFFLKHHLSQPDEGFLPRINAEFIKEYLQADNPKKAQIYICGPKKYSDMITNTALGAGVSKENIHKESYSATVLENKSSQFKIHIGGDRPDFDQEVTIKAKIDGEWVEIKASSQNNLLDSLLDAGESPPFSCMAGACMACMGYVKKGEVWQEDQSILTDKGIENGQTLTCQAYPLSKDIEFEYE